ncbi:hypothetical protein JCM8547_008509 [Rhodosporidiobolus lusitaniae]
MGGSPATLLARWSSANTASAIPILGRALTVSRPGVSLGRRYVQIRSLRLPASEVNGKDGRNLYIVRSGDVGNPERVALVVEDPAARRKVDRKGKGKAAQDGDDDEVIIVEQVGGDDYAHGRWTYSSIGLPSNCSYSSGASALFDTFIQRALFAPPQPGAPPGQAGGGFWQPRGAAVSLEGFGFSVGAVGGAPADWSIKLGSVNIKGGTSAGTTKGIFIEVTYLPVPYLPVGSTFVKDFLLSLFPPTAVRNGEIEIINPDEELFFESGLLSPPYAREGEEKGEWEWEEKHSTLTYVNQFKKEGLI